MRMLTHAAEGGWGVNGADGEYVIVTNKERAIALRVP